MTRATGVALSSLALMLSGCGGGDSSGSGPVVIGGGSSMPTPSPTGTCSLRARQDWAFAQLNEWYLFPETLPASLNPAGYNTLSDYVDALTATARAQGKDRYFTYVTSIAEENAYYQSGETAGFGVRLKFDDGAQRVFVAETFEGAPAANAGLDRGAEILEIGASTGNLRPVSQILAQSGEYGVIDALGSDAPGTVRVFRVRENGSDRVVTLTKANYELTPVSSRYGTRILDDGGRKVGYISLRTFIFSADPALRQAFANFKAQGVEDVIVDLRYNGGGLLSIASLMGNLLGADRRPNDIFAQISYRPEKAAENKPVNFTAQPESITPRRIAFIGFEGSASASELVINAFVPYLHADVALIGANTYGKPVGQIAIDRTSCDDRLRIIAFATKNAAGQGAYYNGLAPFMEKTCQASDDIAYPLGDARENSVSTALDFIAGRSCTPIPGALGAIRAQSVSVQIASPARLLVRERPTKARDVEMPGVY